MNFVFVSLQRINTDRESTSTSLAKELAGQGHQVLYVNPPIDRKTLLLKQHDPFTAGHIRRIKEKNGDLLQSSPGLWELFPRKIIGSVNWIPLTFLFRIFNRMNNRRLASEISKAVGQLGFGPFILINDKDMFRSFYLKELLHPALYIYLDRDYTLGFRYWQRHGTALEPELMKKSDAVICNSLDFTRNASRYNKNSFYIGNGGDLSLFNRAHVKEVPEELRNLAKPVIGYVGVLNAQRLDIDLVRAIAMHTTGTVVLTGPEDEVFTKSDLHQIPNIRFIPKRHTREIPSYIAGFDVCINPQVINKITIGNFPLKIIEYLAMGKPVVATATNTMQEVFSEHCFLAKDAASYIEKIDLALSENNPQAEDRRIEFAHTFSWENVANNVVRIIKSLLPDEEQ